MLRVEDRASAVSAKPHPVCVGGSGTCPPEESGGPDDCHARREEAMILEASMDLDRVARFMESIRKLGVCSPDVSPTSETQRVF